MLPTTMSAPPTLLPLSRPWISEAAIAEVGETLRSGWITSGPKVGQFEKDFATATGGKHAIAVCSATAGLDLCLGLLDLKPGDEVITPSLNWVSGPNLVELHGGRTVFAEIRGDDLQIDTSRLAELITPRTRAIMPVHYAGAPCDLAAIRKLAGERITVIEDAAHATGTRYHGTAIGADSDMAVFSFHPTKNLTTAEGGMIVCQRDDWAERLRLGRFHGIRKDAWKNATRSGKDGYSVIAPGRKYNLTDMQAVLGLHQLRELGQLNGRRTALAMRYRDRIAHLKAVRPLALPQAAGSLHAWHIFVVLLDTDRLGCDRATIVDRLEQRGIGTGVHFLPVHSQEYYKKTYPQTHLPVTDRIGSRLLSLPLFPGMADSDVDRVADALTAIERELIP